MWALYTYGCLQVEQLADTKNMGSCVQVLECMCSILCVSDGLRGTVICQLVVRI